MDTRLSVIICTYNPSEIIFSRCLAAIKKASTICKPFEILVIDNNSLNNFTTTTYYTAFSNECNARLITETAQGLTPARIKGIKEASGDVLVFIDDDNFVAPDFFSKALAVAEEYKFIGAWSGKVTLEFEKQPDAWTKPYWGLLVNREIETNKWSNLPHLPDTMPCGAGLFVRKQVADYYVQLHETGKRNIQLDRSGNSLFSAGDNDLAACACDTGMGVGVFHEISLTHYIPIFRTEEKYLLQLAEGIAASTVVFHSFRGLFPQQLSMKRKLANKLRWLFKPAIQRKFFAAVLRGEQQGRKLLGKQ